MMRRDRSDTHFLLGAAFALAGIGMVCTVVLTGWAAWVTQLVLVVAVASAFRANASINEMLERTRQEREQLSSLRGTSPSCSVDPAS